MTALDKIQSAEERVATLRQGLDTVQGVLYRAEELAVAGHAARRRGRKLLMASLILVAVGVVVLLVVRSRKPPQPPDETER